MLTQARLKELLHYDPDLGWFMWLQPVKGTRGVGSVAGGPTLLGYVTIGVGYFRYRAHHLAWLYMTGKWPKDQIDHRDGDGMNNAFSNLREATSGQNLQNKRRPHTNNKLGVMGVQLHVCGAYRARITVDGVERSLGYFKTLDEARLAYLSAKKQLHPYQEIVR